MTLPASPDSAEARCAFRDEQMLCGLEPCHDVHEICMGDKDGVFCGRHYCHAFVPMPAERTPSASKPPASATQEALCEKKHGNSWDRCSHDVTECVEPPASATQYPDDADSSSTRLHPPASATAQGPKSIFLEEWRYKSGEVGYSVCEDFPDCDEANPQDPDYVPHHEVAFVVPRPAPLPVERTKRIDWNGEAQEVYDSLKVLDAEVSVRLGVVLIENALRRFGEPLPTDDVPDGVCIWPGCSNPTGLIPHVTCIGETEYCDPPQPNCHRKVIAPLPTDATAQHWRSSLEWLRDDLKGPGTKHRHLPDVVLGVVTMIDNLLAAPLPEDADAHETITVIVHRCDWWREGNWEVCWEYPTMRNAEPCAKDEHRTATISGHKALDGGEKA